MSFNIMLYLHDQGVMMNDERLRRRMQMAVSLLHAVYHPDLAYTTCGVVQASASTGKLIGRDTSPQPLSA